MTLRATFALALCASLTAGPAWADTAQVTAANANLRSAPSTSSGVVSRRLVEVTPGPASVSIDHRDVACVVAGQYPKFEACFSPDESVGRGRVLFRAAGVVGIARDPSGGVLSAVAAKALESKVLLTGFAPDGVIVSSTGAAPGTSAGTSTAGSTSAGGGGGIPTIAIVGGVAAAGVLVAVAAGGGGGGDSGSGSGGGGGGGAGAGGAGGGGGSSVAGQCAGNSGNGNGLNYQFDAEGISCTFRYDTTLNLTHQRHRESAQRHPEHRRDHVRGNLRREHHGPDGRRGGSGSHAVLDDPQARASVREHRRI